LYSELEEVEDTSLIPYVSETIQKQEIRSLYESFCEHGKEGRDRNENATYLDTECEEFDDTFMHRYTTRGQKEKQKENEQEEQLQKASL
jgi:hypothetical protein